MARPAHAQVPAPLLLPPPAFTTTVTIREYCSGGTRCPTFTYRTRFRTDASGAVYASDSGIRYPMNGETDVRYPTLAQKFLNTLEPENGWTVGASFAGDILTLYHTALSDVERLTFKERIRFHPGVGHCEVLSWEQWGLSGGYTLSKALVSSECRIEPLTTITPVVRSAPVRKAPHHHKPVAVHKRPRCTCGR